MSRCLKTSFQVRKKKKNLPVHCKTFLHLQIILEGKDKEVISLHFFHAYCMYICIPMEGALCP